MNINKFPLCRPKSKTIINMSKKNSSAPSPSNEVLVEDPSPNAITNKSTSANPTSNTNNV